MTPADKVETATLDDALLAAIAGGDQSAMEQLYDRYSPMVMALALRILRDRAPAEELLNDVFMELWTRVERFDATRASLLTYLLTLCRSRAIDRLRAGRRRAAAPLDEATTAGPASESGPQHRLEDDEHRQHVLQALDQLGADQRAALELAYFDDLSHSQIAARLGKPLGTVKTHVRQGLIRMRELLRKVMGSADDAANGEAQADDAGRSRP